MRGDLAAGCNPRDDRDMRRDEAMSRLKAIEPDIRAFGIRTLSLFGSTARDEAEPRSDIDVFVEPETEAFYGLGNSMGVDRRLTDAFPGVAVGYSTRAGLSKHVRPDVEREAVRVF